MESGQSFSLEYPSINMHSVCRDTKTFPHECLFLMVEGDVASKAAAIMKGESPTPPKKSKVDDEEDDDQVAITEIRFVLPDSSKLQDLFDNMSDCQVRSHVAWSPRCLSPYTFSTFFLNLNQNETACQKWPGR